MVSFTSFVFGDDGDNLLAGSAGPDLMAGNGGDDKLDGHEGNDVLCGGPGRDVLDGGAGTDTAYLGGTRGDYTLQVVQGHLQLTQRASGNTNSETLHNVEMLAFTEGGHSVPEVLARLYEGLLGRTASAADIAYWQEVQVRGTTLEAVALRIAGAPDMSQRSDAEFLALLYHRVLERTPAEWEVQGWLNCMAAGMDRGAVALGFVNSREKLDMGYTVDIGQSGVGVLVRLYHTAFGGMPHEAGFNLWLNALDQGMPLGDIADLFASAMQPLQPQFAQDDAAFIQQLYRTALQRDPSGAERATLEVLMKQDPLFDRGQVLLTISESAELAQLVGAVTSDLALLS